MKNSGFTLIEILVVIGMIALLSTVVLVAVNPARQFRLGRDSQRTSNVNAILNAVGQYIAENKGNIPAPITTTKQNVASTAADLCTLLVPTYIASLPADPSVTTGAISNCATAYDTKYKIVKDANGRITVSADGEEPSGSDNINVTR
jgi:type IV pilus assembly protein PilA